MKSIFKESDGGLWTLNNHLLISHRLGAGEGPVQVPSFLANFWIQIHNLSHGLLFESMAKQFWSFVGVSWIMMPRQFQGVLEIICELSLYRSSVPVEEAQKILLWLRGINCMPARFQYERLSLFCFMGGR